MKSRTTYVKPRPGRRHGGIRWNRVGLAAGAALLAVAIAWFAVSRLIAIAAPHSRSALALAQPMVNPAATATPAAQPTIVPAPAWTSAQREAVQQKMAGIFAAPVFANAGLVVLAQDGSVLYAHNERRPMTPASTLKLVVASTALEKLGPDYRFTTSYVADTDLDAQGNLPGSLWLVGSGDPSLVSNDLRGGAAVLAKAGVRRVEGGLKVDDLAFAGPEINPHWEVDDLEEGYAPPTSAVSLDEDTVEFHVAPGSPGEAASVSIEPPNDRVTYTGSVSTVSEGNDTDLTIDRTQQASPAPDTAAASNDFVLDGHIAYGEMQKYWKPVRDVAGYVGGAAAGMLSQRGIAVEGEPSREQAPANVHPLWVHRSAQLAYIVDEMLVDSNNHTAEQLLRVLGETAGRRGSDESGLDAERSLLAQLGVPHAGFNAHDGSGLSPDDRIPALTEAALLAAEIRRPAGGFLLAALPRPGIEGTVRYHQLTTGLGKVHAKSGHIEGVNGLAGIEKTAHHGFVTFAFIVNDPNADADAVTLGQDGAMDALATL